MQAADQYKDYAVFWWSVTYANFSSPSLVQSAWRPPTTSEGWCLRKMSLSVIFPHHA